MERSWKGDLIDAIKDYLSVLRINPKCKMAHQNLIKNLYALNQFNVCFFLYFFCEVAVRKFFFVRKNIFLKGREDRVTLGYITRVT